MPSLQMQLLILISIFLVCEVNRISFPKSQVFFDTSVNGVPHTGIFVQTETKEGTMYHVVDADTPADKAKKISRLKFTELPLFWPPDGHTQIQYDAHGHHLRIQFDAASVHVRKDARRNSP